MGQEATQVARIVLPDGTPVWARISGPAELPAPGELAYSDTGFTERVEASVESLNSLVTGVARSLAEPLRAVRPDEVSVQFGIELTAKAGKVVGLLADGEAKAGITVTLTWNGGPPDPDAPAVPETSAVPVTSATPAASVVPAAPSVPAVPAARVDGGGPGGAPPAAPRAGASPGVPVHGGADGPSAGGGA
jgi:hypothetical protein